MAKYILAVVALFFLRVYSFPLSADGVADSMPAFKLPWGTWEAAKYDSNGKFYIFQNVRFGKPPTGALRFKKSEFPDAVPSPVLQPNEGSACYAVNPPPCPTSATSFAEPTTAAAPGGFLPRQPNEPDEDCLFADLYVPASAINNTGKPLPVVVWLYGGAFIFGAKDSPDELPFYDATGLLTTGLSTGNEFIFVVGNYRLGSFGWLAGDDFSQNGGVPNAGLWDQRLLIQFVFEYIGLIGGDASKISLWGESAGAGSIMHHLVTTAPPLFSKALMQSPAYLWQWNTASTGYASEIYRTLATNCGCNPSQHSEEEIFACLQSMDAGALQKCNSDLISSEWLNTGLSAFGPAVDGSLLKHLPPVSLALKQFWTNVTSFIVSHVHDESKLFVPCYVNATSGFSRFLDDFFAENGYQAQKDAINKKYGNITDQKVRTQTVIQDSSFTCNTRFVYDAYSADPSKSLYMMQYDFLSNVDGYDTAQHGSDLLPTFYSSTMNETAVENNIVNRTGLPEFVVSIFMGRVAGLAKGYQKYLSSFAATEVPQGPLEWKTATVNGDNLDNVMETAWHPFGADFNFPTVDYQNPESTCGFWRGIALSLENISKPSSSHSPGLLVQDQAFKTDLSAIHGQDEEGCTARRTSEKNHDGLIVLLCNKCSKTVRCETQLRFPL